MIRQGLEITGLGMAYIFAGLIGVLVLALLLSFVFKEQPGEEEEAEEVEMASEEVATEGEMVAAMAATLVIIEGEAAGPIGAGAAPTIGRRQWAVSGRQEQMGSRSPVRRQR